MADVPEHVFEIEFSRARWRIVVVTDGERRSVDGASFESEEKARERLPIVEARLRRVLTRQDESS